MVDERPKYNFPRKMLDVSIGSVHGRFVWSKTDIMAYKIPFLFFQIRTIFYLTL